MFGPRGSGKSTLMRDLFIGQNILYIDLLTDVDESRYSRNPDLLYTDAIAKKYDSAFKDHSFILSKARFVEGHAFHLYIIRVENRKGLYDYLKEKNIFAQVHYIPVHLQPYYKSLGSKKGDFPLAENYYDECLSLPMYPTLTDEEQNFVIQTIFDFHKKGI